MVMYFGSSCTEGCTSPQACWSSFTYVAKSDHYNHYHHHGHPHPQVPKDAHLLRLVGARALPNLIIIIKYLRMHISSGLLEPMCCKAAGCINEVFIQACTWYLYLYFICIYFHLVNNMRRRIWMMKIGTMIIYGAYVGLLQVNVIIMMI